MMAVLCCHCFLQLSTDSSVAGPELLCFLVTTMAEKLGLRQLRRHRCLVTVRCLSVGSGFSDRNAPALGRILNQQGVSSLMHLQCI